MAIKHFSRVQEVASNTPNGATAFNLPGTAATGYRTFAACYANTDLLPYFATNGTDWESGIGTFTTGSPNTIVRTTILESSNSDAAVDFSAGADVELFVEWPASLAQSSDNKEITPGGRLTLEAGVPVSSEDQLAKTTIYYTPFIHNKITLWDGFRWRTIEFVETSIELGTLTANIGYDVFAYLNAGVLALEFLAWTSTTARATEVTLQDGRHCKNGDKTRLLLGSFYADTATTTEVSLVNTYLYNVYNKVAALKKTANTTSHTYTTAGFREWNNSTTARLRHFNGNVVGIPLTVAASFQLSNTSTTSTTGLASVGLNSTSQMFGNTLGGIGTQLRAGGSFAGLSIVGLNYVTPTEYGNANVTFVGAYLGYEWLY